ncbi:MAG TPA: DNA polymerase Y family protein [Acidimicrobiales bacterium]|nr:DNA polymerase Y family protein [Acidimicrobiales bacterium]
MSQLRALAAVCLDWAVIAARRQPSDEVAVVSANKVVATSPAARAAGVRVGMRRREAQGRCPGLEILPDDIPAEARGWEPVVAAIEAFAPGPEVLQPGQLALGARGPSRYFGGDLALATKVAATVEAVVAGAASRSESVWAGCCRVGIADGLFAAGLAAQQASASKPVVVPKGGSAEFLAPLPVRVLALPGPGSPAWLAGNDRFADLADLLRRLGLKTLGAFAALPPQSVLGRFGAEGLLAHRLARGLEERPVQGRLPPPDWTVTAELDPPADQLLAAAFVGKALADELHSRLKGSGLVCTRLAIEAETEHGTSLRRSWRHDGALSAAAIGERVRWQLEGWALQAGPVETSQAGRITKLALVPEEVRPDDGRQLGFWGNDAGAASRAARALARVQGLLGPEAALTGVLQGGRDYIEQVLLVPWGEPRVPLRPGASSETQLPGPLGLGLGAPAGQTDDLRPGRQRAPGRSRQRGGQSGRGQAEERRRAREGTPPWPGRLPGLAPAIVHRSPLPALMVDQEGNPVTVGSRGTASARPARLRVGAGELIDISTWAGPWPVEERWWDDQGRRRARFQVCTVDGAAYLVAREGRRWWVEATYD